MAPTIDIIRIGETDPGPDPLLSELGLSQVEEFGSTFEYMDKITHVVAAPTGAAIDTCIKVFNPDFLVAKKIILLPELQETGCSPKDTPLPPGTLYINRAQLLNTTSVDPNFYLKGPDTRFAPELGKVESRAHCARNFIRDLAHTAGIDAHIAVVTHGAFAHFLAQDFAGLAPGQSTAWPEAGSRSYQFAHLEHGDDVAELVETQTSRDSHPQHKCWAETSAQDRAKLRGYAVEALEKENVSHHTGSPSYFSYGPALMD